MRKLLKSLIGVLLAVSCLSTLAVTFAYWIEVSFFTPVVHPSSQGLNIGSGETYNTVTHVVKTPSTQALVPVGKLNVAFSSNPSENVKNSYDMSWRVIENGNVTSYSDNAKFKQLKVVISNVALRQSDNTAVTTYNSYIHPYITINQVPQNLTLNSTQEYTLNTIYLGQEAIQIDVGATLTNPDESSSEFHDYYFTVTKCKITYSISISLENIPSSGYWTIYQAPITKSYTNEKLKTGLWRYETSLTDAFTYDPSQTYNEGDLIFIVVTDEDGVDTLVTFVALRTVRPSNPDHNPLVPNTDWWQPMVYFENTREYRASHDYERNDLVVFTMGGVTNVYRYNSYTNHYPNTGSAMSPAQTSRWVFVETYNPNRTPQLYFRYEVYNINDVVVYNNRRYQSRLDGNANVYPTGFNTSNNNWLYLGPA